MILFSVFCCCHIFTLASKFASLVVQHLLIFCLFSHMQLGIVTNGSIATFLQFQAFTLLWIH